MKCEEKIFFFRQYKVKFPILHSLPFRPSKIHRKLSEDFFNGAEIWNLSWYLFLHLSFAEISEPEPLPHSIPCLAYAD